MSNVDYKLKRDFTSRDCSKIDDTFFNTNEYKKLEDEMLNNQSAYAYDFNLPLRTTKTIKENADKALYKQIGDNNQEVLFHENMGQLCHDFQVSKNLNLCDENADAILQYINENTSKIEVTKVPISWVFDSEKHQDAYAVNWEPGFQDFELLKKSPSICTGITMINQRDDMASVALVHEWGHALANRNKGIIENYMNMEALSIFMELVAALELDDTNHLSNVAMLKRLQSIKRNIMVRKENQDNGINGLYLHLYSSISIMALFENYKNGSEEVRQAILDEVNQVISGKRSLENTLRVLDITQEEGCQVIQDYAKKLMK